MDKVKITNKHQGYAQFYKSHFGFNVVPIRGKSPFIDWKKWQSKIQTEEEINSFDWGKATGLGVISGIENLRCLDIDCVGDFEIVAIILKKLKLPDNYQWVVRSGSGEGFHIYFYCEDEKAVIEKYGRSSVYKYSMRNADFGHHLELRWAKCLTVLPY